MSKLKEKIFSKKHRAFDLIIGLLIIIVIILIDVLVMKFKSSAGDFWDSWTEDKQEEKADNQSILTTDIAAGQKVFIPILNFHHIDEAPANLSKIAKSYYLEPDKFEAILSDLIKNDYQPIFLSEIVKYLQDKKLPQEKIMAITFDDGNLDFYTQAWPILQKLKIKSNLYVMTGVRGKDWIAPEQIIELDKSGLVEIGSHTVWHPYLTRVAKSEQLFELEQSKDQLKDLLNKEITVLCYPFGLYNEDVKALAKAVGYQAGLTFDQDAWQNSDDLMELKRISVYPGLDVIKFLDKLKK
jgi:peptidoglycan/xylan/chitin deacetylase (PgdA/CDA1 family)